MARTFTIVTAIASSLTLASCGAEVGTTTDATVRIATLERDARFPEPFSYLSHLRELSDGTIFAADPTSQVLVRLDMDAGTADTIGRQGPGPQEYEGPDRVFALSGDSTLLVDLGNGRLIVIDPEGTFVDWTPMITTSDQGEARTVSPRFVDAVGNYYVSAPDYLPGPPDTTVIHRIDRASGEETPVAWAWRTEYVRRPRGAKRPALVLYDDWAVGADGRVAVVRANGYSVDWFLPDGTIVKGPPNSAERFPVGVAEKEAEFETMSSTAIFTTSLVGEGGTERRMSRGTPSGFFDGIDDFEWPETMPVFRIGRTLVSARNEAWVERMMPVGTPGRVDVFDHRGNRLGFVETPARSRIVAFGAGVASDELIYVAQTDDTGLVWLERYRVVRADGRR